VFTFSLQNPRFSLLTVSDFNQMPPNAREIEIPEPEYTDLLNVTVTEKKRKLCADIIGGSTSGNNVRVKKEIGKYPNNIMILDIKYMWSFDSDIKIGDEVHTTFSTYVLFMLRKLRKKTHNSCVAIGKIGL